MSDLIQRLSELHAKATEAPWYVKVEPEGAEVGGIRIHSSGRKQTFQDKSYDTEVTSVSCCCCGTGGIDEEADAHLIVALHNAWPEIAAEIERLRGIVSGVNALLRERGLVNFPELFAMFDTAERQRDEAIEDAERYRWLKQQRPQPMWSAIPIEIQWGMDSTDPDIIDTAIDEAMDADARRLLKDQG